MKRTYDTIIIVDVGVDDAVLEQKIQKVENVIKANEGEILKQEKWGKRKLNYEIKKKNEGNYIYFLHNSESIVLDQLQNVFQFDETVLKSLTVQVGRVRRSRYNRKKDKKKRTVAAEPVTAVSKEKVEGETNG